MGAVVAFCLCFFASANLNPHAPSRFLVRRAMELLRTVPGVVFALLFVIAFGLGPMPGVFAVALHTRPVRSASSTPRWSRTST